MQCFHFGAAFRAVTGLDVAFFMLENTFFTEKRDT